MKKFLFLAVLVMMGVAGAKAQVSGVTNGKELAVWNENFAAMKNVAHLDSVAANGDAVMLVEIGDMKAAELYRFCREWFATKYKSYQQAVQLEDKENGKLIVNCSYPLYFKGVFQGDPITLDGVQSFKLTCDFKDGRFRVKATEYGAQYKLWLDAFSRDMQRSNSLLKGNFTLMKDGSGKPELFELEYRMTLSGMVESMKDYIVKAQNDDDF